MSEIPSVRLGIYRIPTKAAYAKKRLTDKSWKELYGKPVCLKCKQHFKEKEAYEVVDVIRHGKPVQKYQHVECPK